jgi:hypothetical protein
MCFRRVYRQRLKYHVFRMYVFISCISCVDVFTCAGYFQWMNRIVLFQELKALSIMNSRDSSVGIATSYGLDDRMIGVRFSAGAGNFFLRHHVQTGSGKHEASYPTGRRDSFPGVKAAGA